MAGGDEAERDRLEAAPSRAFERASHFARWKPDWLAGDPISLPRYRTQRHHAHMRRSPQTGPALAPAGPGNRGCHRRVGRAPRPIPRREAAGRGDRPIGRTAWSTPLARRSATTAVLDTKRGRIIIRRGRKPQLYMMLRPGARRSASAERDAAWAYRLSHGSPRERAQAIRALGI